MNSYHEKMELRWLTAWIFWVALLLYLGGQFLLEACSAPVDTRPSHITVRVKSSGTYVGPDFTTDDGVQVWTNGALVTRDHQQPIHNEH